MGFPNEGVKRGFIESLMTVCGKKEENERQNNSL